VQDKYESRLVTSSTGLEIHHSTRIVTVPTFCSTGQVVLVDIGNPQLACHVISFDALLEIEDAAAAEAVVGMQM
jgi:hypothetical protein